MANMQLKCKKPFGCESLLSTPWKYDKKLINHHTLFVCNPRKFEITYMGHMPHIINLCMTCFDLNMNNKCYLSL